MGEQLCGPVDGPPQAGGSVPSQSRRIAVVTLRSFGIRGRLGCLKIKLLRVGPGSFCLKEAQLQTAKCQIGRSGLECASESSLFVFESINLQWRQLLEFTALAMGHL